MLIEQGYSLEELLRTAEANGGKCPICRAIFDVNRDSKGEFAAVRLGSLMIRASDQLLHLRGCTTRVGAETRGAGGA